MSRMILELNTENGITTDRDLMLDSDRKMASPQVVVSVASDSVDNALRWFELLLHVGTRSNLL